MHSLVYLPAGFPALAASGSGPGLAPGVVGLTLNTIVDSAAAVRHDRGPQRRPDARARRTGRLRPQGPAGRQHHATPSPPDVAGSHRAGRRGARRPQWHEVRRLRDRRAWSTPTCTTRSWSPTARRWLMAYEPTWHQRDRRGDPAARRRPAGALPLDAATGCRRDCGARTRDRPLGLRAHELDAGPSGRRRGRVVPAPERGAPDRHRRSRRLPGRRRRLAAGRPRTATSTSSTTPRAARARSTPRRCCPNGHVLVFDDGSDAGLSKALCVDPADPSGPPVARPRSRVAEYRARPGRTGHRHAGLVLRAGRPATRGSWARPARLANGDTLIGWAADTKALASEVDAGGDLLWELRLADPKPAAAADLLPRQPDAGAGTPTRRWSTQVSLADGADVRRGRAGGGRLPLHGPRRLVAARRAAATSGRAACSTPRPRAAHACT